VHNNNKGAGVGILKKQSKTEQQTKIIIYKQASATSTVWLSKKHAPQI